jgi:hypothetical protein
MTQTFKFNGRVYEYSAVANPGETVIAYIPGTGFASVAVHAQGGSADVAFSLSPLASIQAGQGRFVPAALGTGGTVTNASDATDITAPVNAVRVVNTGAAPVYVEVLQ